MLKTEMRNPKTLRLSEMDTRSVLAVMQEENLNAARAVGEVLPAIAEAVDSISARMKTGGRLFYVGCGTSGRLGVLDAAECPPTFGVPKETVIGIIAGGEKALTAAAEGAEDDEAAGRRDLAAHDVTARDCVVGISVAGGAKYVLGALDHAKIAGALTVGLTSNEGSAVDKAAKIGIHPDTGAEALTGSTRLKAGSAHKMILNMISTGVMVKMGYVYENLMINLRPSNEKLRGRMIRIVSDLTGEAEDVSERLLEGNGFVIKAALAAYFGEKEHDQK